MREQNPTRLTRKLTGFLVVAALLVVTTPLALATDYEVKLVVTKGKKSKDAGSVLSFSETEMEVMPNKRSFKESSKTFSYSSIKTVDYSHAKKPLLSTGGAVAVAILAGVFVIPFLFMKKKKHWITVQTQKEFAVMKVRRDNYRQIIAEFETKGVEVTEVDEKNEKKIKKRDKDQEASGADVKGEQAEGGQKPVP